jgi:hypothetical protein
MVWEIIITLLLGTLCWMVGLRIGRAMLRRGATANDLFVGNKWIVTPVLVLYVGLVVLAVNLPQWQGLPLNWRVYGMQVSWTLIRVFLLGVCGVGYAICWKTARNQIGYLCIVAVLGLVCFVGVEGYFLAPIHGQLLCASGLGDVISAVAAARRDRIHGRKTCGHQSDGHEYGPSARCRASIEYGWCRAIPYLGADESD